MNQLAEHIKKNGKKYTCSISAGSKVAQDLSVFIENSEVDNKVHDSWRGLLVGYPAITFYCAPQLLLKLDDGREGIIRITKVEGDNALFGGKGLLKQLISDEEMEEDILRILEEDG